MAWTWPVIRRAPEPKKDTSRIPWDVMNIPLEGEYPNAQIEDSDVTYSQFGPHGPYLRVKFRLVPDDPNDEQVVWTILSRKAYCDILARLGIPRTNDHSVLWGHCLPVRVTTRSLGNMPDTYGTQGEIMDG